MTNLYLRAIVPGAMRDPTMCYVPDITAIQPGDVIQRLRSAYVVLDSEFRTDTVRLLTVRPATDDDLAQRTVHDVRPEDIETNRWGMFLTNAERMPTYEECLTYYADTVPWARKYQQEPRP